MLVVPILGGLAWGAYFIFGAEIEEVSTFQSACYFLFRFMLGIANSTEYFKTKPLFFSFYSFCCVMTYFYAVLPISIAVLIDSFETTVMEIGHVTDQVAHSWTISDLRDWMLDYKPWSKLKDELTAKKD